MVSWSGWDGRLDNPKLHHVVRTGHRVIDILFNPRGIETAASEHPCLISSSGSMPTMKMVCLAQTLIIQQGNIQRGSFLMPLHIFPILNPSDLKVSPSPNEKPIPDPNSKPTYFLHSLLITSSTLKCLLSINFSLIKFWAPILYLMTFPCLVAFSSPHLSGPAPPRGSAPLTCMSLGYNSS